MTELKNKFYEKYRHYDPEIEGAVLGVCLLEVDGFARISSLLEPKHFFIPENKIIFEALQEMWSDGEGIDLLTVNQFIYRNKLDKQFESHGTPAYYITVLSRDVVCGAHLERHALIVRQLFAERECLRIQHEAGEGEMDAIAKMQKIQEAIQETLSIRGTDDWCDMSQMMLALANHMEKVRNKELLGVSSGFPTLDKILYGFQPGQLIVIGARPSVGKSAFVGGVAVHAAKQNHKVGVISLEMPKEQIGARFAAIYADMEFWRIYRNILNGPDHEAQLAEAMSGAATLPIFTSDKAQVTASDIRSKAYKLKRRYNGLDLIIVDYLQLIESEYRSSDTREREVAKISRNLKLMAMDLGIPIILLCQLNRESEKLNNKKPKMAHLRESGAIEQDADVVIMLHRDWKSGITQDEAGNSTETQAHLIVEKNRNGETMEIPISFDPEKIKFFESATTWNDAKPYIPTQSTTPNGNQGSFSQGPAPWVED